MMTRSHPNLALSFTLAILLGLMNSRPAASHPADGGQTEARNQTSRQASESPLPPPPATPPPAGQRTPGGGLSGEDAGCPQKSQTLTALTPVNGQGATLSEQPTFWFYIPYTPEEIRRGEFSLLTQDETQRLYRTSFELPETPGLVSIQWPNSTAFSLLEDQYYHWYVNLYCAANLTTQPDLKINGWVQRLAWTPEREYQVNTASAEIWYDAIARLAERLQTTSPETTRLRQDWAELLDLVELSELTPAPLVGPVIPMDD